MDHVIIFNGMEQKNNPNNLLVNRYLLEQPLATGGMALIYKAKDTWLERVVAIKILRKDYSIDPAFRQRFHHEAKASGNLFHPNIVTIFDFGLDGDNLFIVMEFIPGTDLKSLITSKQRFPVDEALVLAIQACSGIGYAHRSGLVHCDVKPQNMLVTPDGRLKVTDFGIARALATIHPEEQSDIVWGSPQYFSPEQAAGLAPSPASDVYSIGVILYEMLTGRLPFTASDPLELARMHREANPPSLHRTVATIPSELEQIVLKVLSKEPSSRYRTADQLGHVLENYQNQLQAVEPSEKIRLSQPVVTLQDQPKAPRTGRQGVTLPPIQPPVLQRPVISPVYQNSTHNERPIPGFDWITVLLGLLATLAVGGLVPFWLYIWFSLRTLSQ